jgi:hypothetical protein
MSAFGLSMLNNSKFLISESVRSMSESGSWLGVVSGSCGLGGEGEGESGGRGEGVWSVVFGEEREIRVDSYSRASGSGLVIL